MTEYFVRNITSVCLPETICKIFVLSLFYPEQRTLCHCEALPTAMPWQSPGRDTLLQTHARYFCTCVEKKAHTSKRVSIVAPDNAISKVQLSGTPRDTCTRGEKAHTSKRVSVIACDNAISKVQCAPRGKAIPPQLRWYCLLMCFRIKELWIVINVNFGARGDFRPVRRSTARRLPLSFRSPKSLQEGFRPHTDYTCRWLRVRALTGLSPAPVF